MLVLTSIKSILLSRCANALAHIYTHKTHVSIFVFEFTLCLLLSFFLVFYYVLFIHSFSLLLIFFHDKYMYILIKRSNQGLCGVQSSPLVWLFLITSILHTTQRTDTYCYTSYFYQSIFVYSRNGIILSFLQ